MGNYQLQARRRQLQQIEQRIQQQFDESETESSQALSAYDNHPADLATGTFHRELAVGLTVGLNRRLHQVRRAQEKIDDGTYGVCDRCGGMIAPARLSALPEAVYCVTCEREIETPYEGPPSEADVVPMPFGDRRELEHDGVETDGEDIWQAVARFGTSDSPQDTPPAVDYFETFVDFDEPIGIVQDVEGIVDEKGEALLDAVRQRPRQTADSNESETDQDIE